ncbi:MAG TPA: hypothetical protein ENK76_04680 [Campylobacterales bacterium]|nr:hypothetical protein [Campylobacterales bacterium]
MQKIIVGVSIMGTLFLQANDTDLEKRVESLEKALKNNQEKLLEEKMQKAINGSASFNQSAFVPNIAFIANMGAVARNINNKDYSNYSIPGFITTAGEIPFNEKRGFNLNYGEMEIYSTVDPYFDVNTALHIEKEGLHIGELYITTKALPYGLKVKAGKFKSDFGRINAKHQHSWHFSSIPLVFESYFGPGGMGDEGIQLTYTAPTEIYLMAGYEAMQGSNKRSFGETDTNNLNLGYIKSGLDITDNSSILAGTTLMHGDNINGKTDIYGADLTVKSIFDSYSSLTWQSELLYRDKDLKNKQTAKQAGAYTQLVYDYNQNWATGVRYDTLFKNITNQPDDLNKYSAIIEYKPFEFSKIRLQYIYDKSKVFAGNRKDEQEILLDLTIESGSHGAHAF